MMTKEPVHILLIEDDEIDVELFERVWREHQLYYPLTVVSDGALALKVLRGEGRQPLPKPYIILLDLNLPGMSGLEFLRALRDDPKLNRSIVFVLSSSDMDEDKVSAYDRHVAGYLLKDNLSLDPTKLITLIDSYAQLNLFPH